MTKNKTAKLNTKWKEVKIVDWLRRYERSLLLFLIGLGMGILGIKGLEACQDRRMNEDVGLSLLKAGDSVNPDEINQNRRRFLDKAMNWQTDIDPKRIMERIHAVTNNTGVLIRPYEPVSLIWKNDGQNYFLSEVNSLAILFTVSKGEISSLYYDRIVEMFKRNLYVIDDENTFEENIGDGRFVRRFGFRHTDHPVVCLVKLEQENKEIGEGGEVDIGEFGRVVNTSVEILGQNYWEYPNVSVACSNNLIQDIDRQSQFLNDLNVNPEDTLFIEKTEGDFAKVHELTKLGPNRGYILKRQNGSWVKIIESLQDYPRCSLVEEHKIPETIFKYCHQD